jgi:hypothetical protein
VQSNVAEVRESLVDELLPIENPPFEPRLKFAEEDAPPAKHMCTRCTSPAVLQKYDLQDADCDAGKRDETWEEWYTAVGSTSTPKMSGRPQEYSLIGAMIGFTAEPDELLSHLSERKIWTRI